MRNITEILTEARDALDVDTLMTLSHEVKTTEPDRPLVETEFADWFIKQCVYAITEMDMEEGDVAVYINGSLVGTLQETDEPELTLQDQLEAAIARQDYEEAARLRDEIAKEGNDL